MKSLAILLGLALSPAFIQLPAQDPSLPKYRKYALEHDGEAARGRELFHDEQRLACARCHSIDGKGGKAGPDLFSVGDQYPRRDIIEAVLQPSANIAVGYSSTVVETKSGEEFQGVLKGSTENWVELAGGDGKVMRIPRSEIKEQRGSSISLMPEGLQLGLTLQEFADLTEFLVSLKEPAHSLVNHRGIPDEILELRQPATLHPLLAKPLSFRSAMPQATNKIQPGLVWFEHIPGMKDAAIALDQAGLIWRIQGKGSGAKTAIFADLTRDVFSARGPNGLLGFAFHPRFSENRKYYAKYQVFEEGEIATVIVEKAARSDGLSDSGAPGRRIIKIVSGAEHHNGGCMRFGPDGYLYIGMGDSAPNHDPQGHGQDLNLLLGKMLRIDVDHPAPPLAYSVPADNPFVGTKEARPEIWASGLREPWRFSFDPLTRELWVGDLGQERGDEITIVRKGENHGWNVYEGFELFSKERLCATTQYIPPIFSTRRKFGITMVGGHVYRGDPKSSFYGVYIFGDYTSKRIWAMTQENRELKTIRQIATCPQSITAFAVDAKGEIYVTGYEGMVYWLDLTKARFEQAFSAK